MLPGHGLAPAPGIVTWTVAKRPRYESTMQIGTHPSGLQLSGPFDISDAKPLVAALRDKDVSKLHCGDLSVDDGLALAVLLRDGVQPWLEQENRRLKLFVVESGEAWGALSARLAGTRVQLVASRYVPD